jgi:hypothetical protein
VGLHQVRQMFFHNMAAGRAKYVADEENIHAR